MSINAITNAAPLASSTGVTGKYLAEQDKASFADILSATLDNAEQAKEYEDYAENLLLAGEVNNLHEVPIALTESELTLNLAIQVRNKIVDAYKEVMNMQV